MEPIATALASGLGGLVIGLVIGYYRARAEMTEKLAGYITREDCEKCSTKTNLDIAIKRLDRGANHFEAIRTDIALIKQYLEMRTE